MAILQKKLKGEITQAEFDYQLACGTASKDERDGMIFDSFPLMPPDLTEFISKWSKKFGAQKDKLQQRLYAEPEIRKFFDTYYTLINSNKSNALSLETSIVVLLANGENELADMLHKIYDTYPKWLQYLDSARTIIWKKKSGSWWGLAVNKYKKEVDFGSEKIKAAA